MVDRLVGSEVNARRIGAVEACFGASGQPLAVPGRVLVGEGVLIKICRKKPKSRQFFLFNDILVYGNIVISKRKYNQQHVIPLEDVVLDDIPDEGELRNGWLVRARKKSFAVYAATASEKKEWMTHINRCVHERLASCGKEPAKDVAPAWVPDNEAHKCQFCDKQFNVIQRRHHCRNCGKVVCQGCSAKKFLLPAQSSRPVRVCDRCHDKLTTSQPNNAPPPPNDNFSDDASSSDDDDEDNTEQDTQPTFYNETGGAH